MRRARAALALTMLSAAACAADHGESAATEQDSTTSLDRLLLGEAAGYPADIGLRGRYAELQRSQVKRRQAAWDAVKRAIEPVPVAGEDETLPRFQTWYGKDEIVPMFEHLLLAQTDAERRAHTPPTMAAVEETFVWAAKRPATLATFSAERLAQRRAELAADGSASLGGAERVLMSPALVAHLLTHYDAMLRCLGAVPHGDEPPSSATNFAPCVGEEFPSDAVMIKARWVSDPLPVRVQDTSASALASVLATGEWQDETAHAASPAPDLIYTMTLPNGLRSRLVAMHVVTKELRDWMWITLFWSDDAKTDFGADRPPDLAGAWSGYKLCAVVDYDEGDTGAAKTAADPSLAAALDVPRAFGPRSWCSNPYLEHGSRNAKTNCIGCHQHAGTGLGTEAILNGPRAFEDGARAKVRANFPADYTFVTTDGLELASRMRAKLDQLARAR